MEVVLGMGCGTNLGLNNGTCRAPTNICYNLPGNFVQNYVHCYDSSTFETHGNKQNIILAMHDDIAVKKTDVHE